MSKIYPLYARSLWNLCVSMGLLDCSLPNVLSYYTRHHLVPKDLLNPVFVICNIGFLYVMYKAFYTTAQQQLLREKSGLYKAHGLEVDVYCGRRFLISIALVFSLFFVRLDFLYVPNVRLPFSVLMDLNMYFIFVFLRCRTREREPPRQTSMQSNPV